MLNSCSAQRNTLKPCEAEQFSLGLSFWHRKCKKLQLKSQWLYKYLKTHTKKPLQWISLNQENISPQAIHVWYYKEIRAGIPETVKLLPSKTRL